MQYRAEFPIEFPEKPGKSIGNSSLHCIFHDPGNFSILPVSYAAILCTDISLCFLLYNSLRQYFTLLNMIQVTLNFGTIF